MRRLGLIHRQLHLNPVNPTLKPSIAPAPAVAQSSAAARRPNLPALTGLRSLLALTIMFFHFTPPHMQLLYPVIDSGYVFVVFFFLLSGYVLAYNYAGRPTPLVKRDFWRARFARLYPVFLLSLAISFTMLQAEWHARTHADFFTGLVLTPLLLQGWSPQLATFWNTVAWTLSAEAAPLRHLPLAHPPAVAKISRPPDRASRRHLGARTGPPFALHSAQPGPSRRANQPLQLRLLAARAQVHAACLRNHLPGWGRPGQAPDCPHAAPRAGAPWSPLPASSPWPRSTPRPSPTCPSS